MAYYVKIVGEGRNHTVIFETQKTAEDLYFRALAVVLQKNVAENKYGYARLLECYLYEVGTVDQETAEDQISNNDARLLQTSVEELGFAPVVIRKLFELKKNRRARRSRSEC